MPRSSARQKLSPARLAKIPAWLIWSEGPTNHGPIPARLEVLGRYGAVLAVDYAPPPQNRSFVQVALGGPPPLHYMTAGVDHVVASGPGSFRISLLDHDPLSPVAFKKLADELTKALLMLPRR